jgi:Cys-tRNA(Pro)/Cys-tRNA(Cys) deacylase
LVTRLQARRFTDSGTAWARSAAERITGYVVGGISPLGGRKRLPAYIDVSALSLDTVFVSAGRRGLQVELSPADLVRLTEATAAQIASGAA